MKGLRKILIKLLKQEIYPKRKVVRGKGKGNM